jgi:hypothetical protein
MQLQLRAEGVERIARCWDPPLHRPEGYRLGPDKKQDYIAT